MSSPNLRAGTAALCYYSQSVMFLLVLVLELKSRTSDTLGYYSTIELHSQSF